MFRLMIFGLTLVAVLLVAVPSGQAIQRVAPKYSFVEFYGGPNLPTGSYDKFLGSYITDTLGRRYELDGDDIYDPGFFLGVNYGQVVRGHLAASVGFRFARVNLDDKLRFSIEEPTINMYDAQFNVNWMFLDLRESVWSPYVGAGVHAGFVQESYSEFADENDAALDFGLNFGVDVKVWKAVDGPQFVTLSSINNWSLVASDVRPRTINIGFGLKYFFK